jgi:hypothetical protein
MEQREKYHFKYTLVLNIRVLHVELIHIPTITLLLIEL